MVADEVSLSSVCVFERLRASLREAHVHGPAFRHGSEKAVVRLADVNVQKPRTEKDLAALVALELVSSVVVLLELSQRSHQRIMSIVDGQSVQWQPHLFQRREDLRAPFDAALKPRAFDVKRRVLLAGGGCSRIVRDEPELAGQVAAVVAPGKKIVVHGERPAQREHDLFLVALVFRFHGRCIMRFPERVLAQDTNIFCALQHARCLVFRFWLRYVTAESQKTKKHACFNKTKEKNAFSTG